MPGFYGLTLTVRARGNPVDRTCTEGDLETSTWLPSKGDP